MENGKVGNSILLPRPPARPTTDFAKEGLFNVLNNYYEFDSISFLDLFGGTGSISYEFASRGCTDITLVEKAGINIKFIKRTNEELDANIIVIQSDVFKFMADSSRSFDIIFAGPPYPLPNLDTIPDKVFENALLADEGILILEHNPDHNFEDHPRYTTGRNYGTTIFSIFTNSDE